MHKYTRHKVKLKKGRVFTEDNKQNLGKMLESNEHKRMKRERRRKSGESAIISRIV